MELKLQEILEACRGRLLHGAINGFHGLSTDTRTMKEGEMYLALRGARFDGHDFVPQALNLGSGAIVSIPPALPPKGKVVIVVDDTLRALHDIARYVRRKRGGPVVGVTGTNGKTTTKEMTASVLSGTFSVLKNRGNLNNQIGLPLSLLTPLEEVDVTVLEMGAGAPGDIAQLCGVALPETGVVTNIGPGHIEGFGDMETVRRTKLELLATVRTAILNADDAFLMAGVGGFTGKVVRYGTREGCDVRAGSIGPGARGPAFTLEMDGRGERVQLKVAGAFNVLNACAAAAVGRAFGVDIEEIAGRLSAFEGVPMRLEIRESSGGWTVLSDTYNANPASMSGALEELLRRRAGGGRAVCALGDMLELGPLAESAHRALGRELAERGVAVMVAVGPLMALAAREFAALGGEAHEAADAKAGGHMLRGLLRERDAVLVKGSRGMGMEGVAAHVI